ncbi:MAG: glutamate formimidoyltransferase [Muribaculaceae bacterium]|jgi:glutamate formiminotransferase|nr:glutamate formimidoyltransferase [Muribaculaceae bacterium]MBO7164932.1 glutamate formimidoyltransferase [Muribaculaceae bacterium]MBQ1185950.1 glutamate formimidoyltransferase [Muribaculaceae bacterium]MBQ2370915.1 glutamate formimidoyltransferase [Muribaculaceae bacterium]MBQ2399317.1 glutamate formimidoyltransferase [Muribaculaceae bacterium]
MNQIIECVPNFSEGRDLEKIEKIVDSFRGKQGVKLLDYSNDQDHNRCVVTVVGEREPLKAAVIEAIGKAVELIDLTKHEGQHPRMGAVDVVPFIPIRNASMEDCIALSKEVGEEVAKLYNLPVFLYEKSASAPHRENLAAIRKGEFEGMEEKIHEPQWHPDFGPEQRHPTAGTVAVGARMPLVAFNINLNTDRLDIATAIGKRIRHMNGGFRFVKAMGVELSDRGIVQVSINMTDYTRTALYRVFETVKFEAARWGVTIAGSEIIGLVPMAALIDTAEYYLGIEDFSMAQVLESRIMEE